MSTLLRTLVTAAGAVALTAALPAQTASFTPFGTGCKGTGGGRVCKSDNGTASQLQNLFFSRTSEVAIEVTGGISSPLVTGFEILTRARFAKSTVKAHVYFAGANGAPLAMPAATGDMVVDTKVAWYRVQFTKPLLVKPGQKFFLSWTDPRVPFSQVILWPVPTMGTKTTSYHRESNSGAWNRGPFKVHPWAWRVLCPGGASVPVLSNTGLPKLGQSYSVDLSLAKGTTGAILITGFSKTQWGVVRLPFDLRVLGATGCSLLVSFDAPFVTATSANGTASLKIPVPQDASLAGAQLHHQWTVVDAANALGLVFSGGGTATLGR